jgi:RHS repeat-associated protein
MSTDPVFMKIGTDYYWYHNDHLMTPQMMTTSSGAVVWKAKYNSFGKATVDSSPTVDNPLRFPGQYEDAETGLHYNYFRYYNPETGRYLRVDPLRWVGGINFYPYALSNPVIKYDPEGNIVFIGTALIVGGTYTAVMALADLTIAVALSYTIQQSMSSANDHSPWSPNPAVNEEFVRDRDKVKEYDTKPPPYQNPKKPKCDEIRERIKHIERAMMQRENFTNKWYDGQCNPGHAGRIKTLEKERDRLQRRLDRGDCQ